LELTSGGVTQNLSGNNQVIVVLTRGTLNFSNSSTAGDPTIGYSNRGGTIIFNDSTAGTARFENEGTPEFATNGAITFINSDAGNAVISNNVGTATITFEGSSSAATATISNNTLDGSGTIIFADTSSAGSALLQNFQPTHSIIFQDASSAGNARIQNNNGGLVEFTDTASAAQATITNAGTLNFSATSTAGSSTITNESASTTTFGGSATADHATITNAGALNFSATSTAGSSTITNESAGATTFSGSATADQATITNAGALNFTATSTAGASTITNNGTTTFTGFATAAQASIVNNATLNFMGMSTGGTATITTNSGGATGFFDSSTGGVARFITNAGGTFDMSTLTAAGMTAGSIEGAGSYFLGSKELTTGLNNLSTTVSGVIADGGAGGGTGGSLIKVGTGRLTINGEGTYTGGTTVRSGAIVVGDPSHVAAALSGGGPISVDAGATLGGYGSVTGPVSNSGVIAAGSATPGFIGSPTGTFTINGDLTNRATVQLGSGASIGNVLQVNGNYIGAGGAALAVNTFLGGDGSPSDRLVINGAGAAATGNTMVRVTNVGGPGAETTSNGILVVNAINGATTTPGTFALANGELRAGAFDYDLFRGGLNPTNSPNDWFLRSAFNGPLGPPGPEPPIIPPIPPILPPAPPPDPLPPGVLFPIIGPELATYDVVQPLARQLGLSILGTLDDRVGDTYEPDGCAVAPAAVTPAVDLPTRKPAALPTRKAGPAPCPLFAPSVWGRFFGQTINNNYAAFAAPHASGNLGGFQGGIDLLRGSLFAGQYERAGLYGAYGDAHADVNGLVTNPAATAYINIHTGSMNLDAWSAGGYWTHVGPGGWYLDAVVQGTWYYGSASTQFARLNTDGTGFIASLEGGVPFSWPQLGPGFVIEPQGQILWQKVSFRHDYDGLGDVALGDTTGPSARIGLRTKWTIVTRGGQVWQPYLRANVWRDWGADANTVYSGTDVVPLESQVTQLELGGGVTGRINANVSVFANADYEFAVGAAEDQKRYGFRGAFGARYTW
jgi:outer membrane autotransporter protein